LYVFILNLISKMKQVLIPKLIKIIQADSEPEEEKPLTIPLYSS